MSTTPIYLSDTLLRELSKVDIDERVKIHEETITPDHVMAVSYLTGVGMLAAGALLSMPPLALAGSALWWIGVPGSIAYKALFSESKSKTLDSIKSCVISSARTAKNWLVLSTAVVSNVVGCSMLGAGAFFSAFIVSVDVPILVVLAYQGIPLKPLVFQLIQALGISGGIMLGGITLVAYSLTAELFLDEEFKFKADFFEKDNKDYWLKC